MTIDQIKYFLITAKCLNFTKAADQLYISQSALSRHIRVLEAELNMQLFIRSTRRIVLTPAGRHLLNQWGELYENYLHIVSEAKVIQKGYSATLTVGILEGTNIEDIMPEAIQYFSTNYSNLEIALETHSFGALAERLYNGTLDLALTLYFDIVDRNNLMFKIVEKTQDYLAVRSEHHLAKKANVCLADFSDETFLIIDRNDSEKSGKLIIDACMKQGFYPRIRYSPSIQTTMLWIESGMGVAILDGRNQLLNKKNMKFIPVEPISDPSLSFAWLESNTNQYRDVFVNYIIDSK